MPKPFSFGEIHLDVDAGRDKSAQAPAPETPFRIAILGDFSGRANRGVCETGAKLAARRAALVDRDNFDQVLAKLDVQLSLPVSAGDGPRLNLHFAELDDFHPDHVFERLGLFRKLRETRAQLADSRTFAAVAAEMGAVEKPAESREPQAAPTLAPAPAPAWAPGSLLEQMIGETRGRVAEAPARGRDELSTYLRQIVAPHVVARPDPRQPELLAQMDRATSSLMRALLHHPDFQALEAAWRSAFLLIRKIETDVHLKLYLLDISKAELAADLAASEDLRATGTYKLLVEQTVGTPGAEPWAVLAGNYSFEPTREDVELLGRLGNVARAAGAPFLSAASPRLLGCPSFAETPDPRAWKKIDDAEGAQAWQDLRKLPQASYLGLALPRFLLRLPYGKKTDRTEQFDFEEMAQPSAHDDYLWGNPAFACALLLAQAFSEYGWNLRPGVIQEIDGLPLHVYNADEVKPCAEALLTEQAAEIILEKGLMPLASLKGRDAVRLVRFQSVAEPLASLSGPWTG